MNTEWIGNSVSTSVTCGIRSQHTAPRPAGDFYATNPSAIEALARAGKLPQNKAVWECAAGQGHLSEALIKRGYMVISTDLHDRGYCEGGTNFLKTNKLLAPCILTNPRIYTFWSFAPMLSSLEPRRYICL